MFAWACWASRKSEQIIHKTGSEMGAQRDDKSKWRRKQEGRNFSLQLHLGNVPSELHELHSYKQNIKLSIVGILFPKNKRNSFIFWTENLANEKSYICSDFYQSLLLSSKLDFFPADLRRLPQKKCPYRIKYLSRFASRSLLKYCLETWPHWRS